MESKWSLRLVTAVLWGLAAASGMYWSLRSGESAALRSAVPTLSLEDPAQNASRQAAIVRFLGASGSTAATPSALLTERFVLKGIAFNGTGKCAALIAVDGQAARPFVVGTSLTPAYLLKSLSPREALLAPAMQAPAKIILSLPPAAPLADTDGKLPITEPPRINVSPDKRRARASSPDSRG